jgi:hypothetical protein
MRYFATALWKGAGDLAESPVIDVVSSGLPGWVNGRAYFCGPDASGEPLWSLRVGSKWIGGLWFFLGEEFRPIDQRCAACPLPRADRLTVHG